jgi:hypothetical protein
MNSGTIRLEFYGGTARGHQIDLYDAGRSIEGLGRTLAILAHYYENQKVLSQAPYSSAIVNLRAPRAGSVVIEVVVAVAGSVISAPIVLYLNHVMGQWLPGGSAADKSRIKNLQAQLEIQGERLDGLQRAIDQRDRTDELADQVREVQQFITRNQNEHDVMRSIASNSFSDIYRPVGRSADFAVVYGDAPGAYTGVADPAAVAQLQSEVPDPKLSVVAATVDAFARKSKRGTAFSKQLGRGFRFHYGQMGKLGEQDDFSWSQYEQQPLLMTGRFYRFFDGSIKRLEVVAVERITREIEDIL